MKEKSPEQKELESKNRSEALKKRWANTTPEQKAERSRKISEKLKASWGRTSPEERAKRSETNSKAWEKKLASMSAEELDQFHKPRLKGYTDWWNSLTEEERREVILCRKKWYMDMSAEEREEHNSKGREARQAAEPQRIASLRRTIASRTPEEREAIKAQQKARLSTVEARQKMSQAGTRSYNNPERRKKAQENMLKMRSRITKESYKITAAKNREHLLGTTMELTGRRGANENHHRAKFYRFKSPKNVVIEGRNLALLIRNNEHLFDSIDLVMKARSAKHPGSVSCNAHKQLSRLGGKAGKVCSWKGWIILKKEENIHNDPIFVEK